MPTCRSSADRLGQGGPAGWHLADAARSLAVPGLLVAAVRELGGIHRDDPTAFLALIDEVLASSRLPAGVHGGPEVAVVDLADASPDVVA